MSQKKVLIVGWYGTETVGDKAILGGIITSYRQYGLPVKITVSSLYPFVTRQTIKELDVQADVIHAFSSQFLIHSAISDEVVMGGGPLMDLEVLSIPLWSFIIAYLFRKKRIIWGCGLGPLTKSRYLDTVRRILTLASEIKLRDSESVAFAQDLVGRDDVELIDDPAKDYIQILKSEQNVMNFSNHRRLACFLRDWPREYAVSLSDFEYKKIKKKFEANLAKRIVDICNNYNLKPVFYSMHNFAVGNDDREFNRRFIATYLSIKEIKYDYHLSTVDSVVNAIVKSRLCLCMRFHSVLFAHTLNKDYIAIDYTNGGKIKGFLKDSGSLKNCISIFELAFGGRVKWDTCIRHYLGMSNNNTT